MRTSTSNRPVQDLYLGQKNTQGAMHGIGVLQVKAYMLCSAPPITLQPPLRRQSLCNHRRKHSQIAQIDAVFTGRFVDGHLHKGCLAFRNVSSYELPRFLHNLTTVFRAASTMANSSTVPCMVMVYSTIPGGVAGAPASLLGLPCARRNILTKILTWTLQESCNVRGRFRERCDTMMRI
jgi:hypothetical protein